MSAWKKIYTLGSGPQLHPKYKYLEKLVNGIHVTFAACRGKRQIHGGKICRSKSDAANFGKNQQKFEKFISMKHWFLIKNVIFVKEDVVI